MANLLHRKFNPKIAGARPITALAASLWCLLAAGATNELSAWENLARDLAPYFQNSVRSFARPVYLFHGRRNTSVPDMTHLEMQIAKAFDPDYSAADMAGPGLYVAFEHLTSANYGSRVLVLEARPTQFRFIDLTTSGVSLPYQAYAIDPRLIHRSETMGCRFWESIKKFNGTKCLELRKRLFEILDISAINYPYTRAKTEHPEEARNNNRSALVLTSLRGTEIKYALNGDELNSSLAQFAESQTFVSVQEMQTQRYVGLNPQFPEEQKMGMGNSPGDLSRLSEAFKGLTFNHPVEDYFSANPNLLTVFRNFDPILRWVSTSFDDLDKNWFHFLEKTLSETKFDESKDDTGLKLTSFHSRQFLPETSWVDTETKVNLPSIRVKYDLPTVFPHGNLPARCQANLASYAKELIPGKGASSAEKTAAQAIQRILRSQAHYAATFEEVASLMENYEASSIFNQAFNSPPCLLTWNEVKASFKGKGAAITGNEASVYLRPKDPALRKKRFYELMSDIKKTSEAKSHNARQVLDSIREILLLDPLPTTSETVALANRLFLRYWEVNLHIEYDFKPIQSFALRYFVQLFRENSTHKEWNLVARMRELHAVIWAVFKRNNAIPEDK